jgi:hypothetical protein
MGWKGDAVKQGDAALFAPGPRGKPLEFTCIPKVRKACIIHIPCKAAGH